MKQELKEHFKFLSTLNIKEITLYRTWNQINNDKWVLKEKKKIEQVKNNIWMPESPEDYLNLEPYIIIPTKPKEHLTWRILRYFTSSAPTLPIPGRGMRITVIDKVSGKYLGIMEMVSDFGTLKPRDDYIGWTKKIKEENKMLNYLAMGATIVPTQPLGFNYVGGKLMSLILCCDKVENVWNSKYKEPLLGITTTSLYGGFSQYTGLKNWKKCGTTEGKILLEPDSTVNLKLRHWMRDNYPDEFEKAKKASRMKTRILYFCYVRLKVKSPENRAPRGVYFCELYDKSVPFLKMDSNSYGDRKFDNSLKTLVKLWKEKYASKRLKNLLNKDTYNLNTLFYDKMIGMEWEEAKNYYLYNTEVKEIIKEKNKTDYFFD